MILSEKLYVSTKWKHRKSIWFFVLFNISHQTPVCSRKYQFLKTSKGVQQAPELETFDKKEKQNQIKEFWHFLWFLLLKTSNN